MSSRVLDFEKYTAKARQAVAETVANWRAKTVFQ